MKQRDKIKRLNEKGMSEIIKKIIQSDNRKQVNIINEHHERSVNHEYTEGIAKIEFITSATETKYNKEVMFIKDEFKIKTEQTEEQVITNDEVTGAYATDVNGGVDTKFEHSGVSENFYDQELVIDDEGMIKSEEDISGKVCEDTKGVHQRMVTLVPCKEQRVKLEDVGLNNNTLNGYKQHMDDDPKNEYNQNVIHHLPIKIETLFGNKNSFGSTSIDENIEKNVNAINPEKSSHTVNIRKRKKLDNNEDQENVVQGKTSHKLENVELEQNQLLTQKLGIYEESHECITPKVILHRNTDVPGDGNCLFHSLICILQLQILTCDLRRQLRDAPYLNSCHNPQEAYNILSSDNEYGDLDCLYLFAKMYNQNICVHYHYFDVISKNEDTRFCHFKANDTHDWIHLDLREQHFTPYFSDYEKKKEDERKKKQKNKEYSKRYRDKKRTSIVKENEETREKKRKKKREYQRAWRQRKEGLKKNDSKEEKEEKKRKRHRENQRAYYQRIKALKENDKNAEELSQKKLDDLPMNVMQCRASQNLENVQLEQNQFFTHKLGIYDESHECITPKVILHRNTDVPGDGNCLFHSLIRILQLQISTFDLRRQLRDSPYLNSCHNPQEAYNILSSDNEYGDLDCLYLFAKMYNQNICVHYHYFDVISKNEDTRFCHFKANDTHYWIHLGLREQHFTPYFSDYEKKKEDERKNKQKSKEYSKRYRDKQRTSNLQTGPSTGGVLYVPPVICSSQIADLSLRDVHSCLTIHSNYNYIEDKVHQKHLSSQVVELSPLNINLQTYSAFQENSSAHRQFEKDFVENEFGHACDICDRLWFRNDLKFLQNNDATPNIEFIRTLLSNIAILKIKICSTCFTVIQKQRIPPLSVYNGFKYPPLPDCLKDLPLDLVTEWFISPKIPFMQIRRLRHVHGQYGIYGQVINVPIEANTMVYQLPRQVDDDYAITVHIKRKKIHKSSYVYGIVTKRKIKVWLQYLKDTPLYKSYGVSVDDDSFNDSSYDVEDEIILDEDGDNDILEQIHLEDSLMAQQQTLMWNDDMYLKIGEGNVTKSLLFDEHAEELSFPQIYLGQYREFRHAVTPFMMATSELRRSDRRGVTPQHLLYMAMKIMRIRIKESLKIALKHDGQGIAITKEQIQSDDYIHGCIETNLAFLRSIPNSAYYWAERKRDLFSMIRQYGKPTVFFTISANEIGWPKLLQLLHNLKNNSEISVKEAAFAFY